MRGKLLFLVAGTGNRGKYLILLLSLVLRYNSRLELVLVRDEGNRTMYCRKIAEFHREQLLFIDESEKF